MLDDLEKSYKLGGGRALTQFKSHLKPIREAFGDMRAVDVTAAHIDDYIDRRLEEDGKAAATINRETELLSQAFNLAIEDDKLLRAHTYEAHRNETLGKASLKRGCSTRWSRLCRNI